MTIIYFVLILGITVFVHELGHFIFAKRAGIYVYEFSIGMGPILKKWKRKNDETEYSIRLLPIGGFVSMAGEAVEADEKIPASKRLQSKTWGQRFMTIIAGIMNNKIIAKMKLKFIPAIMVEKRCNQVFACKLFSLGISMSSSISSPAIWTYPPIGNKPIEYVVSSFFDLCL